MKKHKKNIKKKTRWFLYFGIFLILIFSFVFVKYHKQKINPTINDIPTPKMSELEESEPIKTTNPKITDVLTDIKLNGNFLYKGELDSKTVYFTSKEGFFINPNTPTNIFDIKTNDTLVENTKDIESSDISQVKNKKIIYKTDSDIEFLRGEPKDDYLYFNIHTKEKNILIRLNLKNNKIEQLILENHPENDYTAFAIEEIVGNYIIMYYHGITGGMSDTFILNTNNKNRITIKSKEINRLDVLSGKIIVDLENNKVSYPKGKMVEVNCENNPQEYEMGCEGMFEINGKYFDVISTKEIIELDLP